MSTTPLKLPKLTVRQVFQGTLAVLLIVAVFYFFYRFHQVFLTLFVAIVFSTAIQPIVRFLHDRGLPKDVSIISVYLLILAFLIGGLLLLTPLVGQQVNLMARTIPETYQEIRQTMVEHPNFFIWRIASELPEEMNLAPDASAVSTDSEEEETEELIQGISRDLEFIGIGVRAFFITFAALVLAFYWTLDSERNRTTFRLIIPNEHRERVTELASEAESRLGAFVRGQALLGLIIGSLSFAAYLFIGLPYALALAIVAGIMETVPVIGPILGAVPALIVAYTVDPQKALWVLIATVIIQQVENNILVPRVMKRAVGVNPLVTLLALSAFGSLFGLLGAVVAIPLAAIIQLILDQVVLTSNIPDEAEITGRDKASLIRYETQELIKDIRSTVRRKQVDADEESDEVEDSIEAIAIGLNNALANNGRPKKKSKKVKS